MVLILHSFRPILRGRPETIGSIFKNQDRGHNVNDRFIRMETQEATRTKSYAKLFEV